MGPSGRFRPPRDQRRVAEATPPMVAPGAAIVLEKADPLRGQRKVVALQVDPPLPELVEMPGKPGRAEARKRDDLVDEVGLIEEPTVDRQATPVWRTDPPPERQNALKPLHSVEPLRRETDLRLDELDEPAVAETHALRDVTDGRGVGSAERVEG
jgi:hypothetical protein